MDERLFMPSHPLPGETRWNVVNATYQKEPHMAQLRFKDYLVIAGGILLIALSLSFAHVNPVGSAPPGPSVTVVNTPLPVQGTVNVGNFPASSSVSGSVSITGTPNVSVINTPSSPVPTRDVDNAARQPFQVSVSGDFRDDHTEAVGQISVPAGKRFVIEYVTGAYVIPSGEKITATDLSLLQNNSVTPVFGATFTGTDTGANDIFILSQLTRLYADAGTPSISIIGIRNSPSGTGQAFWTLSGYLVNLP